MALFTKSYAELSEAFVREKLVERQAFGRAGIEEWLADQRGALSPDENVRRQSIGCGLFREALMEGVNIASLLRENAEATPLSAAVDLEDEYPSPLDDLAVVFGKAFNPEKMRLYRGMDCVIFDNGEQPIVLCEDLCEDDHACYVTFLGPWHLVDALFWTWKQGGKRAPFARSTLCNALAKKIAQKRIEAQGDFDKAVAVSEDGMKIVQATEVIVVDAVGSSSCPSRYFFTQKILFSEDMIRFDCKKEREFNVHVEQYIDMCRGEPHRQALVVSCDKKASVFVTHRKFCPDPMPALPEPTPAKA